MCAWNLRGQHSTICGLAELSTVVGLWVRIKNSRCSKLTEGPRADGHQTCTMWIPNKMRSLWMETCVLNKEQCFETIMETLSIFPVLPILDSRFFFFLMADEQRVGKEGGREGDNGNYLVCTVSVLFEQVEICFVK